MKTTPLPLLKFKPVLLPKPWGGDALGRVLGKGDSGVVGLGESWELSDRPEAETRVSEGEWAGTGFAELIRRRGSELLGTPAAAFPLLYKFISAREKLSVQVHPGAGSTLGEAKTECWVVVEAAPGAELILGVDGHGRAKPEVLDLLQSPHCEEVLRRWPTRKGDVFFVPAGTVHAITEGLLLYEVQQNSDTTFRLYDWGRVDAQGKPRPLHVTQALQVADVEMREGYRIPPLRLRHGSHDEDYLVACRYFALVKWSGFRGRTRLKTGGNFRVIGVTSGEIDLLARSGQKLHLELGETALVPACHREVEMEGSENAEAIVSFVPRGEEEVMGPLRAAGHSAEAIAKLFGPPV